MAFFSEVKAKLGLDITPFERGLKRASNEVGSFKKRASQMAGRQFMSKLAPMALVAAFVSVAKKAQEARDNADDLGQAIAPSVRATAELADNLDAAKGFVTDIATKGLASMQDAVESITAGVIAMFDPNLTKEQILAQLAADKQSEALSRAAARRAEKDAKTLADKEKKDTADVAANFKKSADERSKREYDALGDKEKLRVKEHEIAQAQKDYNDQTKSAIERSAALLRKEEAITEAAKVRKGIKEADAKERAEQDDWLDGIIEATGKDLVDAENKRLDVLKAQGKQLSDQRDTIKESLADYASAQRNAVLPTTDEVRSGKRNIGSGARRQVGALDRSQARVRALSDAEQRKMEEFNNASSEGDKRRFAEEGRAIRAQKEAELGRSEKLKGGLESRVSDIDTNAKQLTELEAINKAVTATAEALAPKPL